jgi:hypothetical protein
LSGVGKRLCQELKSLLLTHSISKLKELISGLKEDSKPLFASIDGIQPGEEDDDMAYE